jgi:hypothetical protein
VTHLMKTCVAPRINVLEDEYALLANWQVIHVHNIKYKVIKDRTPFTVRTRVQRFQPFLDRTEPPRPELDANVILRHIKKYVFAELTV